ncbi:MAG TPA: ribosome assembly RNA-binding protein YhbY [Polyangiaceae bacterium]
MPSPVLDGRQRRHLRALAHHKKPVVQIGVGGVTPGVVQALDRALLTHELVKVRVAGEGDLDLEALGEELAKATRAALAQSIGRVLLFYRPHPKKPRIVLPGTAAGGEAQ